MFNGTLRALVVMALLQASGGVSAITPATDNPLLLSGPDPWITREG